MSKSLITLLLFPILFGCSSGSDSGEENPPEPPVETKPELLGSFVGKYTRFTKGFTAPGQKQTMWSDTVWQNDRAHQQLMLWTEGKAVSSLTFKPSSLTCGNGEIASQQVSIRSVELVAGDRKPLPCGEQTSRSLCYVADALSTRLSDRVYADAPVLLWITVDVPSGTTPGDYSGSIVAYQGGKEIGNFDVKLKVVSHALPDVKDWAFHLDLWQFPFQLPAMCAKSGAKVEMFSPAYFQLARPFYALLADAGQSAVTTYIKDGAFNKGQTMVDWTLNEDGTWSFDFTHFDAFVEFMQELGISRQINCFSLAGWYLSVGYTDAASGSYLYKELNIGTEEYNLVWNAFLDAFSRHLKGKGWFDKTVLYMDETTQEEMAQIVQLIHANDNAWKIGIAGSWLESKTEASLYDYSTIIGYDRKSTNPVHTFYTSCTQTVPNNYVTAETSPAEMTWMAWHALSKGFNGYLRWAYDYWTMDDPMNVQDGTNSSGDFSFIYRTSNSADAKPISSVRMELLREGIQDFEKVQILGKNQLNSVLQAFQDPTAPNATSDVSRAQGKLKQLSVN